MRSLSFRKYYRPALRSRFCLLALCAALIVVQPGDAKAQNVDPVAAANWITSNAQWLTQVGLQAAQWVVQNAIATAGNIGNMIAKQAQNMGDNIRAQAQMDATQRGHELANVGPIVAEANVAKTDTTCANVKLYYVGAGAASAVKGLGTAISQQAASVDKGQNGKGGTPAVAAEKNCALSGNGWTFVDIKTYGTNAVPKPCPCSGP